MDAMSRAGAGTGAIPRALIAVGSGPCEAALAASAALRVLAVVRTPEALVAHLRPDGGDLVVLSRFFCEKAVMPAVLAGLPAGTAILGLLGPPVGGAWFRALVRARCGLVLPGARLRPRTLAAALARWTAPAPGRSGLPR